MNQTTEIDWAQLADSTDRSARVRIGSRDEDAAGDRIELVNPADGSAGLAYNAATAEQVDQAIAAARAAEGGAQWWSMPAAARGACLVCLSDLMTANAAELGMHDCLDIGKPISAAYMEAHIAASMCRYFGELADKIYAGNLAPSDPGSSAMSIRKPRGVVAAIVPWNYPVINATLKLAPALAAGNSVVLKASELSPGSAAVLARLCDEAGIPSGTVGYLPGNGQTGSALAHHGGVDMLTFTGSTATGKALMRAVGESSIKPMLLECGGKSPELVFDDARSLGIDALAQAIVGGCMANQGQLCVARSRLYVEAPLYDELLAALKGALAGMRPGLPLDPATSFGPLASPVQLQRVTDLIGSGIDEGADLLVDGRNAETPDNGGCYIAPSLFTNASSDMRIVREEIFGPVLIVAPFGSEEEAIAAANDSEYGLAATAWTTDLGRTQRLMQRIDTGGLQIRATADQRFGAGWGREGEPHRQSGFGIEGGQQGVLSYTRMQSVQIDYPVN